MEHYNLELIREGKILDPSAGTQWGNWGAPVPHVLMSLVAYVWFQSFQRRIQIHFSCFFKGLAKNSKWSDSKQTLLLQCVLTGKAQEAYSALSTADSENFQKVKTAVLKAYELVPEAYRQKFRGARKYDKQTYIVL